jgi:hypothetical protein
VVSVYEKMKPEVRLIDKTEVLRRSARGRISVNLTNLSNKLNSHFGLPRFGSACWEVEKVI